MVTTYVFINMLVHSIKEADILSHIVFEYRLLTLVMNWLDYAMEQITHF